MGEGVGRRSPGGLADAVHHTFRAELARRASPAEHRLWESAGESDVCGGRWVPLASQLWGLPGLGSPALSEPFAPRKTSWNFRVRNLLKGMLKA